MKLPLRALLITAWAAALGGCASAPHTAHSTPPARSILASQQLRPGMTTSQVELIMGEPQKVRESRDGQVWIYERTIGTRVESVATRVVEEVWFDPITNQMKSIPAPVQSLQRTEWIELVEAHMVAGVLENFERTVVGQRSFSN